MADLPTKPPRSSSINPIRCREYNASSLHRTYQCAGILTCSPSGPPFGIPLGPTNPSLITIAKETSVFRRTGFSPVLRLLVPAFSLLYAPPWFPPWLHRRIGRSPTTPSFRRKIASAVSVSCLSPDHLRRKDSRSVSCYAFFKWWLLLSQHPDC